MYYNDYNIEYSSAKSAAAANIVRLIKSYGVKIDGIGSQAHLIVGNVGSINTQKAVLATYTALGVEVAITELDIRMTLPVTDAKLAQQSTDYYNTVSACLQTSGCVGVTIWDWTDKYSWIPGVFSGQGAALPWDENYVKKPAYNGILSALGGATSSTSSSIASVTPAPTTTRATTLVTTASATTSAAGAQQTKWGQCGGTGWTGAKVCVSGSTCTKQNDWYSQVGSSRTTLNQAQY